MVSARIRPIAVMRVSSAQNLFLRTKETLTRAIHRLRHLYISRPWLAELAMAGGVFVVMAVYALQRAEQPFVHDSFHYWNLADRFFEDGEFSFTNYNNGLRGYLYPFILFLIKSVGGALGMGPKQFFYLSSALYFGLFTIFLLPRAFQKIFGWRIHLWGRAVIALLVFTFWRGHFLYPLSDFPAVTALLIGIAVLAFTLRNETAPAWAFLIGFFISAALNIRPAYQFSLIVLLPFFLLQLSKLRIFRAIQWTFYLVLGASLVLLPQLRINQTHFQVRSPWVLARFVGEENLFVKQLFWGLGTQKYETNIGENYPSAAVLYEDPLIDILPASLLRDKTVSGYSRIVSRFPEEVVVSYFRHFFNGIDLFFPTPYVKNIFVDNTLLKLLNYLVWFLAAYSLLEMDGRKIDRVQLAGALALLAPVMLAIPITVEVRFFLPIFLLAYGAIAFGIDYPALTATVFADKWKVLRAVGLLVLWLLVCFTLSAATVENLIPAT